MKINVHIERLVLDGLPVEKRQGPLVQAAVAAELGRLLGGSGIADGLRSGRAVARVGASDVRLAKGSRPRQIGREIAQAVHGGIGKTQ
jgi:hypothetical protein